MSRCISVLLGLLLPWMATAAERQKPLLRDFIGLNTHTIQFKTNLYQPVTRLLRDYHPIEWDLGKDTSSTPPFPLAANRVDWDRDVYGQWRKAGYHAHASLMFDNLKTNDWKNLEHDAEAYGRSLAGAFGPGGKTSLLDAVEVGNEPGLYDDDTYRRLFTAMAKGLRAGDPKLRIATCNVEARKSGRYHKSVECVSGLESMYDILNVHSYAEVQGWPTWRRSYPEDDRIDFLKKIQGVIDWRNAHAPGKEIWLTEFGWDASTQKPPPTGDFAKWEGQTDEQQAQYIVRAFLIFTTLDIDRAYLYWFNDSDKPSVHASSGLTRNFQPKPSFHAVAWLQRWLGDYRYVRTLEHSENRWVLEFADGLHANHRVIAAWKPVGEAAAWKLAVTPERIERMPLTPGAVEMVTPKEGNVLLDGSPVFIRYQAR